MMERAERRDSSGITRRQARREEEQGCARARARMRQREREREGCGASAPGGKVAAARESVAGQFNPGRPDSSPLKYPVNRFRSSPSIPDSTQTPVGFPSVPRRAEWKEDRVQPRDASRRFGCLSCFRQRKSPLSLVYSSVNRARICIPKSCMTKGRRKESPIAMIIADRACSRCLLYSSVMTELAD